MFKRRTHALRSVLAEVCNQTGYHILTAESPQPHHATGIKSFGECRTGSLQCRISVRASKEDYLNTRIRVLSPEGHHGMGQTLKGL